MEKNEKLPENLRLLIYHPPKKKTQSSVGQRERGGDSESLLKGQSTKFLLQPLTLGASKGRAE